ncbi:SDR family oxidoreductase [Cryptosporangium phraense]|uniref:SDR family oxidoreductase n=1 Tax=Cryptosporangium phraense TaxID=2593070 RepID=A0A545ARU5_9ACTN|nr:SDR family oxidoreductase [Cryptosporangium phraense]TQS43405.1 SDR family oxidoreductase [Cryptosporangium phraense]
MADRRALIIGATGITGGNTAARLLASGWEVLGVSRSTPVGIPHVRADVLDADATRAALSGLGATHVFFCTWSRQPTEAENIDVNGAMLRNVLGAVGAVEHVALVTGLKHYLGPFEAYAQNPAKPPYRESQGRLEHPNFYYEQEDILFEAAARQGYSWSVHRPHTVIGYALGNAMNMGVTLAVYGTICRLTGRPFVFPGSVEQYTGTTDLTDARLLAAQLEWAATAPAARNEAFNIVNGDTFAWREMWPTVAAGLGVTPAEYPGHPTPLVDQMADAGPVWKQIADDHGLVESDVTRLAPWWHTDGDLGRTVETHADMAKSRAAGFTAAQDSHRSFLDLFDRLRAEAVIPPLEA